MKKKQTQTERGNVMIHELERAKREIARQKRSGKKRAIPWIFVDLDTGNISPPPDVLRVVK